MVAPNNHGQDNVTTDLVQTLALESLSALRSLKNELIGHPDKKHLAIQSGIVSRLIAVLSHDTYTEDHRVQAAIILATLCQPEILQSIHTSEQSTLWRSHEWRLSDILLRTISDTNSSSTLVVPCLRALSRLVFVRACETGVWMQQLSVFTAILQAATAPTTKAVLLEQAIYAAFFFSTVKDADYVVQYQAQIELVLAALVEIVFNNAHYDMPWPETHTTKVRLLGACLTALCAITRLSGSLAIKLAIAGRPSRQNCAYAEQPMIDTLLKLVRSGSNITRMGSSGCLTNLYRFGAIPRGLHKEIALSVLPILVRLFDDVSVRSQASSILTDLVKDSDDMQKAACEAGAIQKLSTILQQQYTDVKCETIVESALLALAAITLHKDEFRKQVIDANVVPLIVASMTHVSPAVRAAACQCVRSLSRSVAMLRTSLTDTGIANAVFELLSDPDILVKTSAAAAVCNLVLDLSPMRRLILDYGVLKLLGQLSQHESAELRLNAVWAIKHIAYAADTDIKEAIVTEIPSSLLLRLCDDQEHVVQEQACEIVRNIVCGRPENVDLIIDAWGLERLADFLLRKLCSENSEIVISAIYSLVHIAAGAEKHRVVLMQCSAILEALYRHLGSDVENIKIGAVWTIINLTWQEDETTASERRARVEALERLGFKQRLKELEEDRSLDIRERVKTALAQMQ